MKAFQYKKAETGLQLCDLPIPEPGPEYVQIQVMAAGMCHSDCHILTGQKDHWFKNLPLTFGHEVAGIITQLGSSASGEFRVGDRVAVCHICHPIEERHWDLSIGLGFDGGYAEYAVAPTKRVIKIPDNVSFAHAAVAMDALATSYHAVVTEAEARPGRTIGVIGLGGLGMAGLHFGTIKGASVYGFDTQKDKFHEARQLGASGCFVTVRDAKSVVFDTIVDFAGVGVTTAAAVNAVKRGGKVVVVGLGVSTIPVPVEPLILNSVTIVGSLGAHLNDTQDVLALLEQKKIDPLLVEVPFLDIPASLDLLAKGYVKGRLWADPSKGAD
ncbi:chaperonin 10-like protein [Fusarium oxysporum Fo47]|nr:chaperonin 10-like protein [Fusarium oxysporum Fo47]QKD57127.1 chaperonin 10-like protein [Fusarium oxysporum Fo47]